MNSLILVKIALRFFIAIMVLPLALIIVYAIIAYAFAEMIIDWLVDDSSQIQ